MGQIGKLGWDKLVSYDGTNCFMLMLHTYVKFSIGCEDQMPVSILSGRLHQLSMQLILKQTKQYQLQRYVPICKECCY